MSDLPPAADGPDPHVLSRGMGIAGFAAALLGLMLFVVPFLDLMATLVGLAFSGRSLALYKNTPATPGETGWLLAICGLILGIIGLVPGVLISYSAAFRS